LEAPDLGGPGDGLVQLDDLSLATLIALVDRLQKTETPDQFLCREIELDEAYVQADADLRSAQERSSEAEQLEQARTIRTLVLSAHDLLGDSEVAAAVKELNKVIEIKIGL
jgi:hypothetical protein